MLERVLDLLLVLGGQLIKAIDHLCVAPGGLNQVFNLFRCDAAPAKVRGEGRLWLRNSPMPVPPARMLLDGELGGVTEFALLNLDSLVLTFFVGAAGTGIGRSL